MPQKVLRATILQQSINSTLLTFKILVNIGTWSTSVQILIHFHDRVGNSTNVNNDKKLIVLF